MSDTLAERLSQNQATPVYLAEVTAGDVLKIGWEEVKRDWLAAKYKFWRLKYGRRPVELRVNGNVVTRTTEEAYYEKPANDPIWFFQDDGTLCLQIESHLTPSAVVVQVFVPFYFSTHAKIFSIKAEVRTAEEETAYIHTDEYFDPRIESLPNLSLRIEQHFGGIGQIGGGSLSLSNADGYFSGLQHLNWDAGETRLKMAVDLPGDPESYENYTSIGYWDNASFDCSESFGLELVEQKSRLRKTLPKAYYSSAEDPTLDPKVEGKAKPVLFGTMYGLNPIKIGPLTYKIADHKVRFLGFKKKNGETWDPVAEQVIVSTNEDDGTFSVDALSAGEDFSVDAVGLDSNAADVIWWLLDEIDELSLLDMAGWEKSKERLTVGVSEKTGDAIYRSDLSLYLDKPTSVIDIIDQINSAVGSYFYVGLDGKFHFSIFEPEAGEQSIDTIPVLEEDTIQSLEMATDSAIVSKVNVNFAERAAEDASSSLEVHSDLVMHKHGETAHTPLAADLPFIEYSDAQYWAQRTLFMRGRTGRLINVGLHWKGLLYPPGTQVVVRYKRNGYDIDDMFEVLEQSINLKSNSVNLVLGDRRGYQRCGHWAAFFGPRGQTGPRLPERFAGLANYGDGAADPWNPEWAPEIKAWARQNVGYWCNESGLAQESDPESYQITRWF